MRYQDHLKALSQDYERCYGFGLPHAIPDYSNAHAGPWTLKARPGGFYESYLAHTSVEQPHHVLSRDGDAWMSTSMLEIESHAWHLHCARGNVLIAGLGMGMYLHAVAAKPEVKRVVVLEIDADVIEIMKLATNFETWPHKDKINILHADALSDEHQKTVAGIFDGEGTDYLYADIWPVFPAVEAPEQTALMCDIHKPVSAGWWGQEVEFGLWKENHSSSSGLDGIAEFFKHHRVNAPVTNGYARFCDEVNSVQLAAQPEVSFG